MSRPPCPDPDELAAWLTDEMADAKLIERHIETCANCQSTIRDLDSSHDDSVLDELRELAANSRSDEPELAVAVARARLAVASLSETFSQPTGPATALDLPCQLGKYELIEVLGHGGMGTVYRARHQRLGREFAVKVLNANRCHNSEAIARFLREQQSAGGIRHPNVVLATDADEDQGTHFLAMEYLHGADLARVVQRIGPLSVADACEVIRQAAVGLSHIHENGLVHRDLKPSNLMLACDPATSAPPNVKILDLGLAREDIATQTASALTESGQVMGTIDYMAPEQVTDPRSVDIRSDIYGLGCTLFYLLAGRALFRGPEHRTPFKVMSAHVSEVPPNISELRPDCPQQLRDILEKTLAKDQENRFQTPTELAAALNSLTTGHDLRRLMPSLDATANDPSLTPTGLMSPESPVGTNRVLKRCILAVAAVLAVVITLVTGNGQIVIEVNEKNPVFRIDGDTVEARLDSGRYIITAPAGRRQVEVSKNGFIVTGQSITVLRFGERHLKVELIPDSSAKDASGIGIDNRRIKTPIDTPTNEIKRHEIRPGDPLSPAALVQNPERIDGVTSWTMETRLPRGSLHAAKFSPDGKTIATACQDGAVRLLDSETLELQHVIVGHSAIFAMDWSDHNGLLAVGDVHGRVIVWDVSDQPREVLRFDQGAGPQVVDLTWRPKSDDLAFACYEAGYKIHICDTRSGKETLLSVGLSRLTSIGWSPDGTRIAVANSHEYVIVDVSTGNVGAPTKMEHQILALEWEPNGRRIAVDTVGPTVIVDSKTGNIEQELRTGGTVYHRSAVWLTNLSRLATTGNDGIRVWDTTDWNVVTKFPDPVYPGLITTADWDHRTGTLACCRQFPGGVLVLNPQTNDHRISECADSGTQQHVAWRPNTQTVMSWIEDNRFGMWNVENPADSTIQSWGSKDFNRIAAYSPDGKLLAGGTRRANNEYVEIVDVSSNTTLIRLKHDGNARMSALVWRPDGRHLITQHKDGKLVEWDTKTGVPVRTIEAGTAARPGIGLCSDQTKIVTVPDHMILVWDTKLGSIQAKEASGHFERSIDGCPKRPLYACPRPDSVAIIDATSFEEVRTLTGHAGGVRGVNWSNDGRRLATTGDGTLRVWDPDTEQELLQIMCNRSAYNGVPLAWSPDDSKIVQMDTGRTVRIYETESGELLISFLALGAEGWFAISPNGHHAGQPDATNAFVYVIETENGQITLTEDSFRDRFGWSNDPAKLSRRLGTNN